jgi:hypothetical protein
MLRRRSTTEEPPVDTETPSLAGKGRPTPKRADARKQRRSAAPKTRKEAAAFQREKAREQRRVQKQAVRTGDERHLPARDAGPEKRLARDLVDSHFTFGQVFFGVIFLAFALSLAHGTTLREVCNAAALASFALMLVDGVRNGQTAKRLVEQAHGDGSERGIQLYALTRSMLPRWARRPPPRVKRGAAI